MTSTPIHTEVITALGLGADWTAWTLTERQRFHRAIGERAKSSLRVAAQISAEIATLADATRDGISAVPVTENTPTRRLDSREVPE